MELGRWQSRPRGVQRGGALASIPLSGLAFVKQMSLHPHPHLPVPPEMTRSNGGRRSGQESQAWKELLCFMEQFGWSKRSVSLLIGKRRRTTISKLWLCHFQPLVQGTGRTEPRGTNSGFCRVLVSSNQCCRPVCVVYLLWLICSVTHNEAVKINRFNVTVFTWSWVRDH